MCGAKAQAQQPGKVPQIGFLTGDSPSAMASRAEKFRQGLRDLGYVEGKNIVIEWRSWEGKLDRQRPLAAELVRLKMDVIIAAGPRDTRAAQETTATIPIVMIQGGDPMGSGLVDSLARPGGNITGLSTLSPQVSGKRLELLKETVPRLSRVAVFLSSTTSGLQANGKRDRARRGANRSETSIPRHSDSQGCRDRIPSGNKRPGRGDPFPAAGTVHQFTATTDCETCSQEPGAGDLRQGRICGGRRRAHVVRGEQYGPIPPRRDLRG
jgi:ABC-type uncharacterized transport system substrate-binding protein